jgi:bacteriocin biosynthesis cyclodehydratase domain-containing protein
LLVDEAEVPAARVSIVGTGQTVERIAATLALEGVAVSVSRTVTDDACDLGVVVGHYVLDPDSYGFWLRRDLPHLPVIFGDDSVQVGPVVEPGHGPCLYCLEHHRRDADASWSAIASQLWARRSSSETPLVSSEVAARVCRLVLDRLRAAPQRGSAVQRNRTLSARSFRIDVESGEVTRRDWMPHPDCGCLELSADRPGIGSAAGSDQPTTAEVSASRE